MSIRKRLLVHLGRFERWFDARFGWFFTNGMKERPDRGAEMNEARW